MKVFNFSFTGHAESNRKEVTYDSCIKETDN